MATIKQKQEGLFLGVNGIFKDVETRTQNELEYIHNQVFLSEKRKLSKTETIQFEARFDDNCKNKHENFAITATIWEGNRESACGCCHNDIVKAFPEVKHLVKWHLTSVEKPWGYFGNTLYNVSNRDHNGLLKGEERQIRNGKTGELCWQIAILKDGVKLSSEEQHRLLRDTKQSDTSPTLEGYTVQYTPWTRTGEGKEREINAARRSAVWLDATDDDLLSPDLEQKLKDRLPALMAEFKADMLACGFIYPDTIRQITIG